MYHVTVAAPEREALFPSPEARLAAVRAIAFAGRRHLGLFCVADDHVHLVLLTPGAWRPVVAIVQALTRRLGVALAPARIRPIAGRAHLETLVRYVCDQTTHHDIQLAEHPALWPGSAFVDLVGARVVDGFDAGLLREALPRWPEQRFWGALELPVLEPADASDLARCGLPDLVDAGCAAVGVTSLGSREPHVVDARRAVARLARTLGHPRAQVAHALGAIPRTVHNLLATAPSASVERAVRLQVALRLHTRTGLATPETADRWRRSA